MEKVNKKSYETTTSSSMNWYNFIKFKDEDYICITDILKQKMVVFLFLIGLEIEIQLNFYLFGKK